MHGDDASRRHDRSQRQPLETRQAPRAARISGAANGIERLRRPALSRLYPALPRVGPGDPDDAQFGVATRLVTTASPATAAHGFRRFLGQGRNVVNGDARRNAHAQQRRIGAIGKAQLGDERQNARLNVGRREATHEIAADPEHDHLMKTFF